MILTRRFVLLNFPRTGSTFVRRALRTLYGVQGRGILRTVRARFGWGCPQFQELTHRINRTESAERERRRSQHGAYSQIPIPHRGKPVVSVTRHPFDRLVSMYEQGFWRDHPPVDRAVLRARLPSFPELTFTQYLEMLDVFDVPNVLKGHPLRAEVGSQTLHFVRFFARDPEVTLARLTDDAVDSGTLQDELGEVRFLHLESIAEELVEFLVSIGHRGAETGFILDAPPINAATSRRGRGWREYLDADTARALRHRERFLFRMFPEYED